MGKPGLLYVTLDHDKDLPRIELEDWYNNELGPLRLHVPFITSGRRYRATNGEDPAWMALYEVSDIELMQTARYTDLWKTQSQREKDVLSHVKSTRYFYEEEISSGTVNDTDSVPSYMMTLRIYVPPNMSALEKAAMAEDHNRWYLDEHIPLLQKIPGWLRSRRYKLSSTFHEGEEPHWFATHEYQAAHGNGGPEFRYGTGTVWRQRIMTDTTQDRRNYMLHYSFGPYPRDLAALNKLPPKAIIEKPFTFADGTKSTYRLEGNTDPSAPVMVFVNSLMTSREMWDEFISIWGTVYHPQYKFLRYESRGRGEVAASGDSITLEVLAADLAHLLDGLKIQKVDSVVGVSLGGATGLKFALTYPERLDRLAACDFGVKSAPNASEAWGGRVKIAQSGGMKALASPTIRRWFLPENVDAATSKAVASMVAGNDLEGFRKSSAALYNYDMSDSLALLKCKTLFVSGAADGLLPEDLKEAAEKLPNDRGHGGFASVQLAGHLPMVENCAEFVKVVNNFLA